MARDKNIFGGGNPNSLYVPMSEIEQELISRLVASGDLHVYVVDWGIVYKPRITFGDARMAIAFRLHFDRPEVPRPLPFLDLELRTGSGHLLFKDRLATHYGGVPISVAAGVFFDLIWDIAIQSIDPALVKALMPDTVGLTSRLQDRDTGEMTHEGNLKLDAKAKRILRFLRNSEAHVRKLDGKPR